jgi:hypothetical protein
LYIIIIEVAYMSNHFKSGELVRSQNSSTTKCKGKYSSSAAGSRYTGKAKKGWSVIEHG